MSTSLMIIIGAGILLAIVTVLGILSRFRKCKSDQIMVIYGKTGGNKSAKCIQGGAAFVWPIIQGYEYMELTPLQFECNLTKALSSQNIRVDVPTTVTVAISTEPDVMQNAAERLLGVDVRGIQNLVQDIVYGQLRSIIADMTIEQLNADRDGFLAKAKETIDTELRKIGLMLININITDIRDAAGYIEALGKKAESTAINQANVEIAKAQQIGAVQVAEQMKIKNTTVSETQKQEATTIAEITKAKEIALAEADRDKVSGIATAQSIRDSQVAEATKDRDIKVATAQSQGQIGKIEAEKKITISNAELAVIQAEAEGRSLSAKEKAQAEILKIKELANKETEEAKALRNEAALKATTIVPAEVEKNRKLIEAEGYKLKVEKEAEANANTVKITAEGQADAIKLKGLAEAEVTRQKGLAEAEAKERSLLAEANGFEAMIKAAESNPAIAIQYKLVNQYKEIAAEQVKAFETMNFGNITIMDTAGGNTLTDVFKNLVSTVAPALNVMKSMEIPGLSAKKTEDFEKVE